MKNFKNMNIGQFTDSFQVPSVISKEEAWKLLEKKINTEKNPVTKNKTIIVNWKIFSLVSAAAVIVFILWLGLDKNEKYSPAISTSIAENQTCWLPDSSRVQLNSNSSITYNYNKLTGKRNVNVKGDALFEVVKGKEFIVAFNGGKVKVTGTSFYVSAYSSDWLQVDCCEGAVEVTLNNQEFLLNKGKGVRMYKDKITGPYFCDESDVRERLNGAFYWTRISLSEIADLIGYRFGYTTIIDSSLQNRNFSGRLDLNELQQGLMVVSIAMNVDYVINEDRKTISLNAK
jgi:ferric-dicitrate binding protein FerR (iron transport regulator)